MRNSNTLLLSEDKYMTQNNGQELNLALKFIDDDFDLSSVARK